MMKAEPVADVTRNTHNYFAQGGNHGGRAKRVLECRGQRKALRRHGTPGAIGAHGAKSVIGGKLTFLPGATIEGGDDLFGQSEPASQIAYIADSEATTIAALKDDYNALLAAIRNAGLMESAPPN